MSVAQPQYYLEKKVAEKAHAEYMHERVVIDHGPDWRQITFNGRSVLFNPNDKTMVTITK